MRPHISIKGCVHTSVGPSLTNYFSSMNFIKNHCITSPTLKVTINTAHHQHHHHNHYHLVLLLRNHQSTTRTHCCFYWSLFPCFLNCFWAKKSKKKVISDISKTSFTLSWRPTTHYSTSIFSYLSPTSHHSILVHCLMFINTASSLLTLHHSVALQPYALRRSSTTAILGLN